ncbi:serine/threonine-protein kinase pim-3-like [Oryzias latipes]|uniref:serine/threonine-protein kinase pim-3-like n=1 Tax=Oryzias latipes TaxID=8090 RepID=UPI000CE23953|nr:serine/threonine-protein kinase pim-3-like [Oryzias latipes]
MPGLCLLTVLIVVSFFAEPFNATSRKRKLQYSPEGVTAQKRRRFSPRSSTLHPVDTDGEDSREKEEAQDETSNQNQFEVKYEKRALLGEGGYGSVYAGFRVADRFPVAIKYIPQSKVLRQTDNEGKQIPTEVLIMQKAADGEVGSTAAVLLLDHYDQEDDLILVMERPTPVECLFDYRVKKTMLEEDETKIILKQLVKAAKELEDREIFHQDIKMENILVETSSTVPRVRLIDFGLSSFTKRDTMHKYVWKTTCQDPPEFTHCRSYSAGPTTVWQVGVGNIRTSTRTSFPCQNKIFWKDLKPRPELSKDCKDFLEKCLASLPHCRPALEDLLLHPWLSG